MLRRRNGAPPPKGRGFHYVQADPTSRACAHVGRDDWDGSTPPRRSRSAAHVLSQSSQPPSVGRVQTRPVQPRALPASSCALRATAATGRETRDCLPEEQPCRAGRAGGIDDEDNEDLDVSAVHEVRSPTRAPSSGAVCSRRDGHEGRLLDVDECRAACLGSALTSQKTAGQVRVPPDPRPPVGRLRCPVT